MAQRQNSSVLRYFRTLYEREELASLTDRQLLQRFAAHRCQAAFTALVRRHGPMVLGVCARILKEATDAEDAVQATFLVLARKGRGFGWQDSIGNWLYGVALRVACRMRSQRQRSNAVSASLQSASVAESAAADPAVESTRRELVEKLDESLSRLPDKYRAPLVLCYLEGKTHQEAASELKLPVGSISRHVARGLDLLRDRLGRSGLCLSPELLITLLTGGSWRSLVQRPLAESITQTALLCKVGALAASGAVSARIITLAEGVSRTMIFTQMKLVVAAVLAVGMLGAGGLLHAHRQGAVEPLGEGPEQVPQATNSAITTSTSDPSDQSSPSNPAEYERKHRLMWSKLDKPVVLEKGLEKMTFGEAKQYLEDRFDITILTDSKAFKLAGVDEPLEVHVKLDKMSGISLRHVLGLLADQFNAVFVVLRDHVVVTTLDAVRPETWVKGDRSLVPRVHADFKDVPLDDALRDLALQTGISVVLDRRSIDPMPHVTALFDNVALDTAVEILANMCSLKAVALDRSLYVTNVENATEMIAERERLRNGPAAKQQHDEADKKAEGQKKAKEQPKKQ